MRPALLALLALAVTGCGVVYTSPTEKLEMSVLRYNDAVRWRNLEAAAEHVPAAKRRAYIDLRHKAGTDLTILDYDIAGVRQTEPNKKAEVIVQFTWNRLPSNVVETTTFKQEWEYGEDKIWWFVGQQEVEPPKGPEVKLEDRF